MVVQRPDEAGIRLVSLYLLAKRHHLLQVQPVAVQHVKMEHNRAGSARDRTIEVVQVAKQIAVKQTKQRNVGDRRQTWRLLAPADSYRG